MSDAELLRRLLEHDFSVFEEQSQRHLAQLGAAQPSVSKAEQQQAMERLQLVSNYDHFYFITNIQTNELGDNHGVEKFLGYKGSELTMKKYLSIIHPRHLLPRNLYVYFWREQLLAGNFKIRFMDHRLITRVAVKSKSGKYVLLKYMSFIFQHDSQNRVFEYMNLAAVLHDYNNEPYSMLMNDERGNPLPEWEEKVRSDVKAAFLNSGVFSDKQVEILKYISKSANPDFKIGEIAAGLNEHEEHIKTQCRRAKDKINDIFKTDFTETRTAFSFLLMQGLI